MFEVSGNASLSVPCLVAHIRAVNTMLLMRPSILLTPWIPRLLLRHDWTLMEWHLMILLMIRLMMPLFYEATMQC